MPHEPQRVPPYAGLKCGVGEDLGYYAGLHLGELHLDEPNRLDETSFGQGCSGNPGSRTLASEAACEGDSGTDLPTMTSSPSRSSPATTVFGRAMGPVTAPMMTSCGS